jgi:drug/metabolite transporter (DMT)-like permease
MVAFRFCHRNGTMRRMQARTANAATHRPLTASLAFAALVAGAVAMGASPVFVRHADVGPFASAFWRVTLALPVLLVWAAVERLFAGRRSLKISLTPAVLLSGLFFAGDLSFWHLAILHTTVANATFMACLAPVWVLILSGIFIGETVSRRCVAGLVVCLTGAGMLVGSSYSVDPSRLIGDFYGLATSLFFGLYFLAIRVARRSLKSGELMLASTFVTAIVLFAVAAMSGNALLPASREGLFALASLGFVSQAGGQGLLTVALGTLSAVFSSLVIFIEAVAAAVFGWLFFSEAMGPLQLAGAALILGGIWLARPRQ